MGVNSQHVSQTLGFPQEKLDLVPKGEMQSGLIRFDNFDETELFEYCPALKSVDFSGCTLNSTGNFTQLFTDCKALESVKFGKTSLTATGSVINLVHNCAVLKSVTFEGSTFKVNQVSTLVTACAALETANFSKCIFNSITTGSILVNGCGALKSLDASEAQFLGKMQLTNLTTGCANLETLNLSKISAPNVTELKSIHSPGNTIRVSINLSNAQLPNVTKIEGLVIKSDYSRSYDNEDNPTRRYEYSTYASMLGELNLSSAAIPKLETFSLLPSVTEKQNGSEYDYNCRANVYCTYTYRFYLREYSNDIMVASTDVFEKYTLSAVHEVPITLSGSLNVNGMRVTKAAYLDLLNQMSPVVSGRKLIQFVNNAAVASNMYVISDEMHTKARVARQREMQTGKKILYGSAEFLEFMRDYFRRMVGGQHE